jgi:ribonucleoside-diphosphate reductase alpha chain
MTPTASAQTSFGDPAPSCSSFAKTPAMQVRKRNGSLGPADVNKIVRAVERSCGGLEYVDPLRIASRTIGGLFHGASTKELDLLSIQTAASLIAEEPEYSTLAARLLLGVIDKEVANQDIYSFSQSVTLGKQQGLISEDLAKFVSENSRNLNDAIENRNSDLFEYFGLRTVYDRYLLRNPGTRDVLETPQYFFLRVACGLSRGVQEAIEFYRLLSGHDYTPSSPTLFNSGTRHRQMSSCYLLDSPADNLEAIYDKYKFFCGRATACFRGSPPAPTGCSVMKPLTFDSPSR